MWTSLVSDSLFFEYHSCYRDIIVEHRPADRPLDYSEEYTAEIYNILLPVIDLNSIPWTDNMLRRLSKDRLNTLLINAYYYPHYGENILVTEEGLPIRPKVWSQHRGCDCCTLVYSNIPLYSRLTEEDHVEEYMAVFASNSARQVPEYGENFYHLLMGSHMSYFSFKKTVNDSIKQVLGEGHLERQLLVVNRIKYLYNKRCLFAKRPKRSHRKRKNCRNCFCWVYHLARELPKLPSVDYTAAIYVLRVTHPALLEIKAYLPEQVISRFPNT